MSSAGPVGLRPGTRVVYDDARRQHALLFPEGVLLLNDTAAAVLLNCDAVRDIDELTDVLKENYDGVDSADVVRFVDELRAYVCVGAYARPVVVRSAPAERTGTDTGTRSDPMPFGLLAELTYRCPLRCAYCSNPTEFEAYRGELDTAEWCRVFDEARELGVLQVHLSGGEPMARRDVAELVGHANELGMYTNLITSGIGLNERRLADLVAAGLDHVQLSVQDAKASDADAIAGIRAHERKAEVAELVTTQGLPLSVNVVLHRANIEHLTAIAELAVAWGADRLELANTQYYGWGLLNRAALLPTREQLVEAGTEAEHIQRRYGDQLQIVYVRADYYDGKPKPCMEGWGSRQLVVAPNGAVLPCPAASAIPDLDAVDVRSSALGDIWYDSTAFNRFRGTDWMREPCRSCALREVDFGGCRCQAYLLTGDAANTDPACSLSPEHTVVQGMFESELVPDLVPRRWR